MCRLAIYSGLSFKVLARGLHQLEMSCGGDGNGHYDPVSDTLAKGVKYTTAEVAFESHEAAHSQLFHTRLATVGECKDDLNHPFVAGEWVLAHNGGWYEYLDYLSNEESDTQTAATLVADHGPGVLLNPEFDGSGVWVLARPDHMLVIPRSRRGFTFQWLAKGGFFHASERIKGVKLSKTLKAEPDHVYSVAPDGSVSTITIPVPDMPEAFWDYPEWETYEPSEEDLCDRQDKELLEAWYQDEFLDGIQTTDFDA